MEVASPSKSSTPANSDVSPLLESNESKLICEAKDYENADKCKTLTSSTNTLIQAPLSRRNTTQYSSHEGLKDRNR